MNAVAPTAPLSETEVSAEELVRRMEKAFFADDFEESRRLRNLILDRLNEKRSE